VWTFGAATIFYVRWQEKNGCPKSHLDIEQGNERDASLAARSILQMNPSSASAARIMANWPSGWRTCALDWRRKVVAVNPRSVETMPWRCPKRCPFSDLPTAERTWLRG